MVKRSTLGALGMVALALLGGCSPESVEVASDPSKITYSRDARTDLCFATLGIKRLETGGRVAWSFSTTNVPCTLKVLALVPSEQRP